MAGLCDFLSCGKLLLILNLISLQTVFADDSFECFSYECNGFQSCCGYHSCCTDYSQIWYVWLILVFFVILVISLITLCRARRRKARARRVIRGAVVAQRPPKTVTSTTIHTAEQQQPIVYGYAPPMYGATGGYQNPYQQQGQFQYAAAPPAYQPQETKAPSAPHFPQ